MVDPGVARGPGLGDFGDKRVGDPSFGSLCRGSRAAYDRSIGSRIGSDVAFVVAHDSSDRKEAFLFLVWTDG
jgi:hypothetical protein